MSSKKLQPTMAAKLLSFALLALTITSSAADRPNVLLITADDLGLQLSCYGDPIAKTPNLDRLAADAVRFRTAYVSQASCSPSRSSMFTGLYPHGNGQYGLLNADVGFQVHEHLIESLLPNVLKQNGYRTGIIGKLHVGPEKDFAFDMRRSEGFGNRDVRLQVEFAKAFVSQTSGDPWFLMFNLFDPHVARQRQGDGSRGPQYFPDQVKDLPTSLLAARDVPPWPWQQIDTPGQRKKIAGYYNCVHRIDAAIGMLMSVLEESENLDHTLIIFLGDHGPPFTRGKTSCYESGLRVPFLVKWPGVSEPHVSDRLVSSVDIYPTVLDAAKIERPAGLHGRSLRTVLRTDGSGNDSWRSTLVAEFHYQGASPFFPRRAITDGRYKLIHNLRAGELTASETVDGDSAYAESRKLAADHPARAAMARLADPPEWELYDLQTDPIEFRNRSGEKSLADVQSRLVRALTIWQADTADPFGDAQFRKTIEAKYQPSK